MSIGQAGTEPSFTIGALKPLEYLLKLLDQILVEKLLVKPIFETRYSLQKATVILKRSVDNSVRLNLKNTYAILLCGLPMTVFNMPVEVGALGTGHVNCCGTPCGLDAYIGVTT